MGMSPDESLPVLPTIDRRAQSKALTPRPSDSRAERQRLADIGRQHVQEVLTVHPVYGQPPGDLAYVDHAKWTPEQQERAGEWLLNERHKDWWRSQGQAQRQSVSA